MLSSTGKTLSLLKLWKYTSLTKTLAFASFSIACVGWSSVNTIAGAQTLRVVANEHISHAVGVVVIAIITLFVGLMGYKWVHMYEKYSWIPTAITFIVSSSEVVV